MLTLALVYQAGYSAKSARELGGKYATLSWMLFSVGTILPAIAVSFRGFVITRAQSAAKASELVKSIYYKVISVSYLIYLAYLVVYRIYIRYQWNY